MKSLGQQTSKFRFQKSRPSPSTARTRNYSLYNQKISQNLRLLHSFLCFFFLFFFSSFFSFLSQHTKLSQVQISSPTLSLFFKLTLFSFGFRRFDRVSSQNLERSPSLLPLFWLFISDPFVSPTSIHFPMHSALENSPSTSKPHSPITLLTNSPCKLTPLSFQLASPPRIHMDYGGLQETQNKAQNGPTIQPNIDLELMGPSHVGIGLQNHQNQCSIHASSMNRLNRMLTDRTD